MVLEKVVEERIQAIPLEDFTYIVRAPSASRVTDISLSPASQICSEKFSAGLMVTPPQQTAAHTGSGVFSRGYLIAARHRTTHSADRQFEGAPNSLHRSMFG